MNLESLETFYIYYYLNAEMVGTYMS